MAQCTKLDTIRKSGRGDGFVSSSHRYTPNSFDRKKKTILGVTRQHEKYEKRKNHRILEEKKTARENCTTPTHAFHIDSIIHKPKSSPFLSLLHLSHSVEGRAVLEPLKLVCLCVSICDSSNTELGN